MNIIEFLGWAFGLIGCCTGVVGIVQSHKEAKKNRSINWEDIPIAVQSLAVKIRGDFIPEVIFIPNEKGCIIAKMLKSYFEHHMPCIVGISIDKDVYKENATTTVENVNIHYHCFETTKWYAYIPNEILEYKNKRLLIVDDFAMSGDYLFNLTDALLNMGFQKTNIRTMCLATTEIAINDKKAPDYYWRAVDKSVIYLPWGKPK